MNPDYYGIIMAGGVGSRFWPVSTPDNPKQFHDMLGSGKSLLRHTFERLTPLIPQENILVSTNLKYSSNVRHELPELNTNAIIAEPAMRNTAPAILYACMKIHHKNPNALTVIAPSDHWINNEPAFIRTLNTAFKESRNQKLLMTLGIIPDSPHTGYGYIRFEKTDNTVHKVSAFTEKPDKSTAEKFITQGNYLWNAGIFVWPVTILLEAYQTYLPAMYRLFEAGYNVWNTTEEAAFIKQIYPQAQNISIDYGIMEKAENVGVIPLDAGWNDLGSWGALHKQLPKDKDNNAVINAKAHLIRSNNNIIRTEKGKKVIVKGLENYIIVETSGVLMIVPAEDEQSIKEYGKLM